MLQCEKISEVYTMDQNDFISHLVASILPFLPVLFGAVEFIKSKKDLEGQVVEAIAVGIFVVYGGLAILAFFFPGWATYILGGAVFLLMCALAPSGFYKFVNDRTTRKL